MYSFKLLITNRTRTHKSFILDAFGKGIFDFLVCFIKIGELGLKSKEKKLFSYTIIEIDLIELKQYSYLILAKALDLKEMICFGSILNAIR